MKTKMLVLSEDQFIPDYRANYPAGWHEKVYGLTKARVDYMVLEYLVSNAFKHGTDVAVFEAPAFCKKFDLSWCYALNNLKALEKKGLIEKVKAIQIGRRQFSVWRIPVVTEYLMEIRKAK